MYGEGSEQDLTYGRNRCPITASDWYNGSQTSIHEKFCTPALEGLDTLSTPEDVATLTAELPHVKKRIVTLHKGGNEIEFEQMLIRANNSEPRLLTDYLISQEPVSGGK